MALSERSKTVIKRAIEQARDGHLHLLDNVVHQLRYQHKYTYAEVVHLFNQHGMSSEFFEECMYELDCNFD